MHKGGRGIRILRKTVLFHSTERFCQGSLLCLRKLSIPKNVKNKKRGGHQDPRQCFWLTVLTHFVGEHFSVSANFYIEIFRAQEGEVYHDFPLKFFSVRWSLTVPKHFVEEPYCASKTFWDRKVVFWIRNGVGITILRQFFGLTVLKHFVGEHILASEKSSGEIFHA